MRALRIFKTKPKAARKRAKSPPPKPRGLWRRLIDDVAVGRVSMSPATFSAVAFLCLVIIYGIFAGGYVRESASAALRLADGYVRDAGFAVREIKVEGQKNAEREVVLLALGLRGDASIFAFDLVAARARIESLSWVRSARVSRLLPDTIRVEITERKPLAIWQRGGRLSVIDENGTPLSDSKVADFAALPLIVGFGGAVQSRALLEELDKWPTIKARMRAAVRVSMRRWNIKLRNNIDIRLPESGIDAALAELVKLDEEKGLLSRDIRAVDLRIGDRLTIELGEEAAARRRASLESSRGKKGARDKRI